MEKDISWRKREHYMKNRGKWLEIIGFGKKTKDYQIY